MVLWFQIGSPSFVRQDVYFKLQFAAVDDFVVRYPRAVQRFAVQLGGLDAAILLGNIMRDDGERAAFVKFRVQLDRRLFHQRTADDIHAARRIQRIQSDGAPYMQAEIWPQSSLPQMPSGAV